MWHGFVTGAQKFKPTPDKNSTAEITESYITILVHQHIFQFDIHMKNSQLVELLYVFANLFKKMAGKFFGNKIALFHDLEKLPQLYKLHRIVDERPVIIPPPP